MLVKHAREVPEYEIDPKEFDFTNSVNLTKVGSTLFLLSALLIFLLHFLIYKPLPGNLPFSIVARNPSCGQRASRGCDF